MNLSLCVGQMCGTHCNPRAQKVEEETCRFEASLSYINSETLSERKKKIILATSLFLKIKWDKTVQTSWHEVKMAWPKLEALPMGCFSNSVELKEGKGVGMCWQGCALLWGSQRELCVGVVDRMPRGTSGLKAAKPGLGILPQVAF